MSEYERIAALAGPEVSVKQGDLSKLLNKSLLKVGIHIGGNSTEFSSPEKLIGVETDNMSDAGKKVYSENLSAGSFSILTPEQKRNLNRLEAKARNATKRNLVAGFLPTAYYQELKEEIDDIKTEYLLAVEEIYKSWDSQVAEFLTNLTEMLEGIRMPQRKRVQLFNQIRNQIPSKEAWKNYFYMTLDVSVYPAVAGVPEGLDSSIAADIEKSFENETLQTAILAAEESIGKGWTLIGNALKTFYGVEGEGGKGEIKGKSVGAIRRYSEYLKHANILSNPLLTKISERLDLVETFNGEDRVELLSECYLRIYGYAKDKGLDLSFDDSPWNKATMDARLMLLNNQISPSACKDFRIARPCKKSHRRKQG